MGADSPKAPAELVLGLLRGAIAQGRARTPKLRNSALTFAVERPSGLTDFFTLYVTDSDVLLETGAAPIEWDGRLVTVFTREDALSGLADGGTLAGADVHGDVQVLEELAPCLDRGLDFVSVRRFK